MQAVNRKIQKYIEKIVIDKYFCQSNIDIQTISATLS